MGDSLSNISDFRVFGVFRGSILKICDNLRNLEYSEPED
jgi:hypothetical protein